MPPRFIPSSFYEKYPFTTGVIRKTPVDLSVAFEDRKITIAGWQTILANNNFSVCSHLSYKIHSQNNAAIPLLPFCSIEDKWIKQIYLTNDADQPGISVDFIIVHPPTKLNYTGIYSQTIDTEGSITSILNQIKQNTATLQGDFVLDDFSGLLKWIKEYGTGDSVFELDATLAYKSNQSLHMKTRTTDAAQNDMISASRSLFVGKSKTLSVAIPFYLPALDTQNYIQFSFQWTDGAKCHSCDLRYYPSTPDWRANTASGTYTPIVGSDVSLYTSTWHMMVLKADFITGKYISLQLDHLLLDLSALPLYVFTSSTDVRLQVSFMIITSGAAPTEISLGEVLISEV
ncbi:hypothetical protein ES703_119334 [subsurface metagenome]